MFESVLSQKLYSGIIFNEASDCKPTTSDQEETRYRLNTVDSKRVFVFIDQMLTLRLETKQMYG